MRTPMKYGLVLMFISLMAGISPVTFTKRSSSQISAVGGGNIVDNAGFEFGFRGWARSAGCAISSDAKYSGMYSLEMRFDGSGGSLWTSMEFPAEAGRIYRIGSWIRTSSMSGTGAGASASLSWLDSAGALLGYSNSRALKGFNEWSWVGLDVAVPRNAQRLRFTLKAEATSGLAWFDDVSAIMIDEVSFRFMSVYPNYRSVTDRAYASKVVFGYEVKSSNAHPASNLALDISVLTSANQVAATYRSGSLDTRDCVHVGLDLSGMGAGDYLAIAKVSDHQSNQTLQTRQVALRIEESQGISPKVKIDRYNRCLVDGVPFFPLGIYSSGTTDDEVKLIGESRFNCIMDYAILGRPADEIARLLDLLHSKHIKTIFSLKDCYEPLFGEWTVTSWGPWKGSLQVVRGLVNSFKKHPGILAWYVNDEKEEPYIPQIRETNNLIRQIDPDHPTWQILWPGQNAIAYIDTSDILGFNVYPVWQKYKAGLAAPNLDHMISETLRVSNDTMRGRAVWMVPEFSSFKSLTPNSLPPTYEEMMCLAYQAIVGGARGLIFYNFRDLRTFDGDAQWQVAKSAAQAIWDIADIALGMDMPVSEQVRTSDSRISALTRAVGSETWILAVNTSQLNLPVTFSIPEGKRSYRQIDAGPPSRARRSVPLVGWSFRDSIEPMGVRSYRLRD